MNRNEFIRFALVLSDGQAGTFRKNLTKIVKLVLFDCFGSPITIFELSKRVNESYSLEFSDTEIYEVIKKDRSNIFIETQNSNDPVYFTYTITPEEYEKLSKKSTTDHFVSIVTRFAEAFKEECKYSSEEIKNIVLRYVYFVFNSDIRTVLSLMNYKGEKLIREIPNEHFTDNEACLLNAFLNWDDKDKNQFLYLVLSSCYEYCMMTVKKDNSAYTQIFNGKEFYLDSNIVFRLAGFNNNSRKEVVESFLIKCKECGIKMKYTNFTSFEIRSTLIHQVSTIRKLLNGDSPICFKAMKAMSSKYANLDFYQKYVDWTKKPGHKAGDYNSFLKYLQQEVDIYLSKMKFTNIESCESNRDNRDFVRLCDELSTFKASKNKDIYEAAIKTDIENYIYMRKFDVDVRTNSFLDKKAFFITADHSYIDWAKEKTPGAIPTFVLPSVWYSIMLKYKGRTDNDYNAFCQFLNLRISEPEDELAEMKGKILRCVLKIDEPSEIKEEIIFDIDSRLSEESAEIFDIEAYVKEAHERITEAKVQEAIISAEKRHEHEKDEMRRSDEIEALEKHDEGYNKGKDEGYSAGFHEGIARQIRINAEQIVKRNQAIHVVSIIFFIAFILILATIIVISCISWKENDTPDFIMRLNDNSFVIFILTICGSAFMYFLSQLNKYVDLFSINIEKVEKKLKQKDQKMNK